MAFASAPAFAAELQLVQVFHGENDYMSLFPTEYGVLDSVEIEISGSLGVSLDVMNYTSSPGQVELDGSQAFFGYGNDINLPTGIYLPNKSQISTIAPFEFGGASLIYDVSNVATYMTGLDKFYGYSSNGGVVFLNNFSSLNYSAKVISGDVAILSGAYSLNSLTLAVTFNYHLAETDPVAVPEVASWAMMVTGFGIAGAALRKSRRSNRGQARLQG